MATSKKTYQVNHEDESVLHEHASYPLDKRAREESKRERKEAIKNARKRQQFFGYRSV